MHSRASEQTEHFVNTKEIESAHNMFPFNKEQHTQRRSPLTSDFPKDLCKRGWDEPGVDRVWSSRDSSSISGHVECEMESWSNFTEIFTNDLNGRGGDEPTPIIKYTLYYYKYIPTGDFIECVKIFKK